MENNNGKGIFYGVIGVATLIVAIIGATFAYFTATTASGQYLTGTAATASLEVKVQRLTGYSAGEGAESAAAAKYVMVPQLDKGLSQAVRGTQTTENTPCIDANGSLVCSIYKILVHNTGSAAIDVSGSIAFYTSAKDALTVNGEDNTPVVDSPDSKFNHLKWAKMDDPTDLGTGYTYATADASTTIPNTLTTYSAEKVYDTLPDGTTRKYIASNTNQYLYARAITEVEGYKDLLGVDQTPITTAHGAYTDLIDPTDDLIAGTFAVNTNAKAGAYRLAAKDQVGDTKVFYVVVWISENLEAQNEQDFGTFTGQVTFNSSNGSGATSTFTEAYGG